MYDGEFSLPTKIDGEFYVQYIRLLLINNNMLYNFI